MGYIGSSEGSGDGVRIPLGAVARPSGLDLSADEAVALPALLIDSPFTISGRRASMPAPA